MSMWITSTSAYQQLQAWHASQKAMTDDLIGSAGSASLVDNSAAFTSVSSGYYTQLGNLAGRSALTRVQNQVLAQAAQSQGVSLDAGLLANQAAGNAILAQFGYGGGSSKSSSSTSNSSSSGTYTAPINGATGYSYTQTSAASLGLLNAVNLLA